MPQIQYLTNDSWEEVSCLAGVTGYPLLLSAQYANGTLYVLTIPDNFGDLYHLPPEVLSRIKEAVGKDLYVRLEAPSQVVLFVYDNDMFIVESFLPESVDMRLVLDGRLHQVIDVLTGETLSGADIMDWRGQPTGQRGFATSIRPHSYRVFQAAP